MELFYFYDKFLLWCCIFLQDRELKTFKESLKHEMKLLKHEIDLLPKEKRKDAYKETKEKLEVEHSEKVIIFL